jgi:ribosomal protein S18 acetylase RimI-like enzyme
MVGVQKMDDNAAEIRRLRVRGSYRRHGIGTLLMETALAFCRHHGYLKLVLDVRIERGPAIALFEKFGFTLTRSRDIDGRKLLDFYLDLYREPKT